MRTPFLVQSKSIFFLPLAWTDLYLVGEEGEEKQAGDLIMGLVSLTNAKQVTGRRDKKGEGLTSAIAPVICLAIWEELL